MQDKYPESAVLKYHHTGIFVSDLQRSIKWYGEMLGYKLLYRRHATLLWPDGSGEKSEQELAMIQHGDHYLELFQMDHAMRPFSFEQYRNTLGTKHLCLTLPDDQYELVWKYLADKGVEFTVGGPAAGNAPVHAEKLLGKPGGLKVMYFKDPDDILIEINASYTPELYYPNLQTGNNIKVPSQE
jgi:catechol 2,3-dioxygenase-like lactoylglutathione lyase family enzyme